MEKFKILYAAVKIFISPGGSSELRDNYQFYIELKRKMTLHFKNVLAYQIY